MHQNAEASCELSAVFAVCVKNKATAAASFSSHLCFIVPSFSQFKNIVYHWILAQIVENRETRRLNLSRCVLSTC